jgi:hypothetical protein
MNIPTDIIATVLGVLLTAVIGLQCWLFKRINKLERSVLTIVVMLADRGFKIPDASDTDRILRSKN